MWGKVNHGMKLKTLALRKKLSLCICRNKRGKNPYSLTVFFLIKGNISQNAFIARHISSADSMRDYRSNIYSSRNIKLFILGRIKKVCLLSILAFSALR